MKPPRVLLDLDCVLAHFQKGAAEAHGVPYPEFEACQRDHFPGEYGTDKVLSRLLGRPIDATAFWGPVARNAEFWLDLEPLPWATRVFELIRSHTYDWEIVTSHSRCLTCVPQKEKWLRHYLGAEAADRMTPCRRKHLMAKPGVILLDDADSNCRRFFEEGGHAVTFPALHNHLHADAADPMPFVEAALKSAVQWQAGERHKGGW